MAVDIVKNGIVAELTDPKIVRNGIVEDINYIYSCKGGADSLVWQRRKKNEYAEFWEWLKGDGTAYINTGVDDGLNIKVHAIVMATSSVTNTEAICGARYYDSGSSYASATLALQRAGTIFRADYSVNNRTQDYLEVSLVIGVGVDMTMCKSYNKINNTSKSISVSSFAYPRPMYLFYVNQNKDLFTLNKFSGKVNTFEVFDSDELTMFLSPCKLTKTLPSDKAWDGNSHAAGECGMWDSVSDKFYGNANTSGTFTVSDED